MPVVESAPAPAPFVPEGAPEPIESPIAAFGAEFKEKVAASPLAAPENKKLLIIIGAAAAGVVALLLILCLVFCGGSGSGDAEEAVMKYCETMVEGDLDAHLSVYPEFLADKVKDRETTYKKLEKQFERAADDVEDFEIETLEDDELKKDEIKQLEKQVNEARKKLNKDYDKIEIEEAVNIKVELYAEVDGDSDTSEQTITVYKDADNGNWYIWENNFGLM